MEPILDIITVTKDDPEGVAATIYSTRKLRACPGIRQIIIDSSSEPVSGKVKELALSEHGVEYIWQSPCGISAAFNLGVSTAKAEWVWFLNGRDEAHPDLDGQFFLQILNSSQAGVIIFQQELMQSRTCLKHPPLWALWPPMYWLPHPATLIRNQLFKEHGAFDENYKIAMDADLWMRLSRKDVGIDLFSMPVVLYDQNGMSSTNLAVVKKEAQRIVSVNMDLLVTVWVNNGIYLVSLSNEDTHQKMAATSHRQYVPFPVDQIDPSSFEAYKLCLDALVASRNELATCRNELATLEFYKGQYNALLQSRSWKITKPLRFVMRLFR
ncbi:MAG: glycosyltransferase [Nitrosomonadales bacterium]|nr:glycosyltransferase [Nitrosomonadales bacterium]